jgi:hypothetical protein
MNRDQLQRETLKLLASGVDSRLGRGEHYLAEALKHRLPSHKIYRPQVQELIWSVVAQGLAYIDFSQSAPENWRLELTEAGRAAAGDQEYNPDDPSGYLSALISGIPAMSPIVRRYAEEAVHAYNAQLYFSSAVMLGVASEAAFLELAEAFAHLLRDSERKRFEELLRNEKANYLSKFVEFRKKVEPMKPRLPEQFADGIDLWLNAVLDLLRIYRNKAGHPKGAQPSRNECFLNLRMFAPYLAKMYRLKAFCEDPT